MREEALESITIAICSNRSANLMKHTSDIIATARGSSAVVCVVFDELPTVVDQRFLDDLQARGVVVYTNDTNRGLSYSRNVALDRCTTKHLMFIDDDVTLSKETLVEIQMALRSHDVVGPRILGPSEGIRLPFYMTAGQLHYLGIHNPRELVKQPWGACFAFNVEQARRYGTRFREELGRKGRGLQSGDDTSFIGDLRNCGATVLGLNEVIVQHHIDPQRTTLRYLLRRVFWQGRSERRRANVVPSLSKEWNRYTNTSVMRLRKWPLAVVYFAVFLSGILYETGKRWA